MFFKAVKDAYFDTIVDFVKDGKIDPNVTDEKGRDAISYLMEDVVDHKNISGAKQDSIMGSELKFNHNKAINIILFLISNGAKPKLKHLFAAAQKGNATLINIFSAKNDIDVTEQINGETAAQVASKKGYVDAINLLCNIESRQATTRLLEENKVLLKQILKTQEQDRLERAANMEQTKNLLMCMMSYMECLGSTNSSFSHRSAIMDKFHSHLYNSPRPRD